MGVQTIAGVAPLQLNVLGLPARQYLLANERDEPRCLRKPHCCTASVIFQSKLLMRLRGMIPLNGCSFVFSSTDKCMATALATSNGKCVLVHLKSEFSK